MPTNTKALQVAEPAGIVAGKNFIINGGFDIWQRGTSAAGAVATPGTGYLADRWQNYRAVSGSTFSRQTTSDTTNLPNIQYCMRVQRDSGNTNTTNMYLGSNVEIMQAYPLIGKTITFSFYARAGANYSSASNILAAYVVQGTNATDTNGFISGYASQSNAISQSATLTTTWQRFTYSGTLYSNTTQFYVGFTHTPTGTAGAADYFEVTGVQVELGNTATPFSRAGGDIQGELAKCQRYYETGSGDIWSGNTTNGSTYYVNVRFAVVKRANPTVTLTTTGVSGFPSANTATISTSSFRIYGVANATGAGAYCAADAWNASIEL